MTNSDTKNMQLPLYWGKKTAFYPTFSALAVLLQQERAPETSSAAGFPASAAPLPLFTFRRHISGVALDPMAGRLQTSREGSAAPEHAAEEHYCGGWRLLLPALF